MAAALQHPHLLPIYDYGVEGDCHYLVMRVFDAHLRQYLRSRDRAHRMSLQEAIDLFRQLAAAVDYLHRRGHVHANLKPENILLDTQSARDTHAFVSDFGVAALGMRGIGTPIYMPPEGFESKEPSPATDIFALGLILYESLTGELPFKAETTFGLFRERAEPPAGFYCVTKLRHDLPAGVDAVIAGLTQPKPESRYATASMGIAELERVYYAGRADIGGTVFVSYAREDSAYVSDLCRRLRGIGVRLWSDHDIAPGVNWDRAVEGALRSASKMLVVMSPAATRSENVQDEWSYFLQENKPVHPFVYQPCELPFRLRRRQHIVSSGDLLGDIARIIDHLSNAPA